MQYQNELRKLQKLVSKDVWELFEKHDVIIAGGAITSVFCNREVNDLDVYFRSPLSYLQFCYDIYEGDYTFRLIANNMTDRSILLKDKVTGQDVQLIIYKFFKDVDEVFADYDFTVNMGALEFDGTDEPLFQLHKDFLKHNSQRYLSFNEGTAYPLISALRVAKYVEKGYNISRPQMLRVLLAVNKKEIDSWEKLTDEVAGMYGLDMKEVFPVNEEFSLDKAMECFDKLSPENEYKFKVPESLNDLYKPVRHFFEPETKQKESPEGKYFKNVKKLEDGSLVSHYKNSFVYKVGEIVNGGREGIWVHEGEYVLIGTYAHADSIILELEGKANNSWDLKLMGDVFVKAAYTKEEFTEKFETKEKIPYSVRILLEKDMDEEPKDNEDGDF